MSSKFFTNKDTGTVLDKFKGVFKHANIDEFDALVGYFRSTGYFRLRQSLESVKQIRILVGIDMDKMIQNYKKQGLMLISGAKKDEAKDMYKDDFVNEINHAEYGQEPEHSIHQFIDDIDSNKVQIRVHPSRKLHAKIYIFRPQNFNEHSGGEVITGSSNLTEAGLGVGAIGYNYEFNVSLRDYDDIKFATEEFEGLWEQGIEISSDDIRQARDRTFLRDDFTPYDLYIKFLIEYFGKRIEFDPDKAMDLPEGYMRLNYQLDAVDQGLSIIKKHNGVFLSDVVGLGKTIIAIMLAKRISFYEASSRSFRILIVSPPAIKEDWDKTVNDFSLPSCKICSSGSLHKLTNIEQYDLVIIDEAHRFRNKNSDSYDNMQRICKTPTKSGRRKKVILISATPLNNRPEDILNQILLFQDGNRSTLECGNLNKFFTPINKKYSSLLKKTSSSNQNEIAEIYEKVRKSVIESITVRRTRRDLLNNQFYSDDLKRQNISFPKSNPPENLLYQLPSDLNDLYDETLHRIAGSGENEGKRLHYARHRMIEFLLNGKEKGYDRASFISEMLTGIMKTLMVKRLDSSINAIYQTLRRFLKSSEMLLTMRNNNKIYLAPTSKIDRFIENENEYEPDEILDGESEIFFRLSDFRSEYWSLVERDHKILIDLVERWRKVIESGVDPKLNQLVEVIRDKLYDKKNNPEQKLVIFSESLDTTNDIKFRLEKKGFKKILNINSSTREQLKDKIKENFDASISHSEQLSDYDIIITTEVLSEGINLHRANIIVNYDTPWNSTKLMQRIGRINRIGSKADQIFICNFLPTEKVEEDINLKHRASVKLRAFHLALGEDSQIFLPDEEVGSFGLFEKDVMVDNEVSEELHYLQIIRSLREKNPKYFRSVKQMPVKIRGGVDNSLYSGNTFVFLRNADHHESFFMVSSKKENLGQSKLTFVESAKILECEPETEAILLHADHYRHVEEALGFFRKEIEKFISDSYRHPELKPRQRQAIEYLKTLRNMENLNQDEKERLNQAIETIRFDRIQGLTQKINKLKTRMKNESISNEFRLRSVLNLLEEYPLNVADVVNGDTEYESKSLKTIDPSVVIAQSYGISSLPDP